MTEFWSVHTHSKYSTNDALSSLPELVDRAVELGYPALGLTDHGNVGGLLRFYRLCRQAGIEPTPGVELYLAMDRESRIQGHNLHLTVNAYSEVGYRNLCRLVTMTAKRHFYKPLVDLADLAELAEAGHTSGLAVSTGCWFGLLPAVLRHQGERRAVQVVETLQRWFPRVYVELQAHGIDQDWSEEKIRSAALRIREGKEIYLSSWLTHQQIMTDHEALLADLRAEHQLSEDEMVNALVAVAHQASAPVLITTDAHYVWPGDQPLHDGLKTLCGYAEEPDSARFPGGPYMLFGTEDLGLWFEPQVVAQSQDSLAELAEVASCRIPEIENYRMLVPDITHGQNTDDELERRCMQALKEENTGAQAGERVRHELTTVRKTEMAPYLLLVAWVCDWMRENDIVYRVRGSANNFYLNYLLGISQIDSYSWGLRPERFLSEDRTKPPDVDLDVQHDRRVEVEKMLGENFVTVKVGSLGTYKLWPADEDTSKGSLRTRYFATKKKQGQPIDSWRDVPQADRRVLEQLSDHKLVSGYGQHASGWVLAPDQAAIDALPFAYIASSKMLISAYDKNDVEDLGLCKLDVLGARILTAMDIALRLAGIDESSIPLDDPATYKRISNGYVESLFQLEGATSARGAQRLRPQNIRDLIACMALFRPGVSEISSEYMARRKGVLKLPQMHPDIAEETRETYGLFVYQEQVIGALRKIGMPIAELNALLKAVKASNDYVVGARLVIEANLPRIRELAVARGWSERDVNLLAEAVEGYAEYGFGEGHATGYGVEAYQTAWLAEHYPHYWWTGVLTAYAKEKDEPGYLRAARRYGVYVMGAHVNRSDVSYRYEEHTDRVGIRRGLMSIQDIGPVAAGEIVEKRGDKPFSSMQDFGQRVLPRRVHGAKGLALCQDPVECGGHVKALYQYGAFDGLPMQDE